MADQRGQAIVETAIVIPLMILLAMVVCAAMVIAVARLQVDAATSLAAASAASAPIDQAVSRQWAQQSFDGSLHNYGYLQSPTLEGSPACSRSAATPDISCHGYAILVFSQTPLAWLGWFSIRLDATAHETAPQRRSQ